MVKLGNDGEGKSMASAGAALASPMAEDEAPPVIGAALLLSVDESAGPTPEESADTASGAEVVELWLEPGGQSAQLEDMSIDRMTAVVGSGRC